uniref:GST C-terminal domain-containing protein n=1 Tax=Kalanchoe fedtschenkoi TaxID=63787 RepID=A0A7N0TR73_KALFE
MWWFLWLRVAVEAKALDDEKTRKEALAQVYNGPIVLEGALEECSKGKPLFGGDQVGYIDIVLGSFLGWIRVAEKINEIKLLGNEKTRGLAGWAEKFVADEAAKEMIPNREKMMKYAKALLGEMEV